MEGVSMPEENMEALVAATRMGTKDDASPPYARVTFPTFVLPKRLRTFVEEASDALGVPCECVATPALATCAAAIGATCRVVLNPSWSEPAVIWAVTLMESGSLKTPAYNAAMEPLRVAQRLQEEDFVARKDAYRLAKRDYENAMAVWQAQGDTAGERPVAPVEPRPVDLFTSDSTVEALAMLFDSNPRGIALTRDELSGFFGSFGAYKGGRGSDESTYLEFYNAGTVKLNRASGKRIYVHAAALSIFGTCQPSVFLQAVGANGRSTNQVDNGLAARFLIAAPAPKPKRWREPKPFDARDYWKMIAELFTIPTPRDAEGHVEPALITLLPEATARFAEFVNEHGEQTASITNPALRYHYAKLEAVAARLALIFYLCDGATQNLCGPPGVQERHVLAGIALARWYGREAMRVYVGYESAADREKRELLEVIRDHGGVITPSAMGRRRKRWANPETAELALRALVREGWGTLDMEDTPGRQAFRFRLHADGRKANVEAAIAQGPGNVDLPDLGAIEP